MKNIPFKKTTLSALVGLAAVAGGIPAFAQGQQYQVNFTSMSHKTYKVSAPGAQCYDTPGNVVCNIDKNAFLNTTFTVTDDSSGQPPCTFKGIEGGQVSGPIGSCALYGSESAITQQQPVTVRLN